MTQSRRTPLALATALIFAATGIAAGAWAAPPAIDAPLPAARPWHGKSEALIARPGDPWITPIETSDFRLTPDYATTRAWLERLVAAYPATLSLVVFGKSADGRDLYYVRASHGGTDKPVLLVQGGIHAGEIDGKDAGMMLLRDLARGRSGALLDKADLVFVPIFNVDGHERSGRFNRPNQRGPENQGWRTTTTNYNLNRDYLKADAPEMRAMIALLHRLNPALYLDAHVTDGIDYQYDVCFQFSGWGGRYAQSPAIGRWLDTRLRPIMDAALRAAGHVPGFYVDSVDPRDPDKGINHTADTPRFSTGYGDIAHIPTVLIETHSLKPYRQRVLGTYVFIETALKLVGDDAGGVKSAIAADRAARPDSVILRWKSLDKPIYSIPFLGIAHDTYRSPASGRDEVRWLGRPVRQTMAVYGEAPELTVRLPRGWIVPASMTGVIDRLALHGVAFTRLDKAETRDIDMVRLSDVKLAAASEGHVPLSATFTHGRERLSFPAGSVYVPADQPNRLIAAWLLEPESTDGMLAWNYYPGILSRTEYIEAYAIAPLAEKMMAADPALKAAFEAKLKADPAFAADGNARLAWFYQRSPYYDATYLRWPIGRDVGE